MVSFVEVKAWFCELWRGKVKLGDESKGKDRIETEARKGENRYGYAMRGVVRRVYGAAR